jgi:long-subunit acyl-CoA synthetase (AMP-forming)
VLGKPPKRFRDLSGAIEKTRKMYEVAVKKANKDTLAYLVFSSGTSGLPKGAHLLFFSS